MLEYSASMPYTVLGILSSLFIIKVISNKNNLFVTLILNVIFGGGLYIILNLLNLEIPLNAVSGALIAILGIPGTILICILKLIFKVF